MIRGYVSSDDDYDDDFYSDPLIVRKEPPKIPEIQTKVIRDEVLAAMELDKKISLFMKNVQDDNHGDKIPVLEKLLASGVPVDASPESHEWTPLMIACSSGKSEIVQFLLNNGANPNASHEFFTPLMACCTQTYISENLKLGCLLLLLQFNADVNATDKYRTSALMHATGSQYVSIVEALLGVPGINVNLQDKEGSTALFYGVLNNDLELVKKLVDAGTNLMLTDRNGRKAVDIALLKGFDDAAALLGHVETVDEIETVKVSHDIMDDLPDENGNGGFFSDVQPILEGYMSKKLSEKVSLPKFLNVTESELKEIGVPFEYDRLELLKCTIHQYHLTPWKKSSMPLVSSEDLSINETIDVMSALLKHLTIANASLLYLRNRIMTRLKSGLHDAEIEPKLLNTLINIYITAEKLEAKLTRINRFCHENIVIENPHDFIEPHQESDKSLGRYSPRRIGFGIVAAATVWVFCHLRFQWKISNLLLPFTKTM